jgi:beta-galactosidase
MNVVDHSFVIGDFVWTAFDYLGEASIGWRGYWQEHNFYPWNLAYCGDIETCGWKRPQSYYRDALWKDDQLSIFVKAPTPSFEPNPKRQPWSKWHWQDVLASWSWPGFHGKAIEVDVYSSCEEVELFLNGKSLGKQATSRSTQFVATWSVPYEEGVLKAVGYRAGKQVTSSELSTAGQPVSLKLSADRTRIMANGQDLSYITVELLDAKGVRSPIAENNITFAISGPGEIVAVANGNPRSVESYQRPQRKAWQGRCLVIIKARQQGGVIKLGATAKGLKAAQMVIRSI